MKLTEESTIELACNNSLEFADLSALNLTVKEINTVLQKRAELAFKRPTNEYERTMREIYAFIEELHPKLSYKVFYMPFNDLKEKFPENREEIEKYKGLLSMLRFFVADKDILKSKRDVLEKYYNVVVELSLFNAAYHFYDEIKFKDIWLVHKILNGKSI